MVNRIMLNETSYHGAGAVSAIPGEIKARGLKSRWSAAAPPSSSTASSPR